MPVSLPRRTARLDAGEHPRLDAFVLTDIVSHLLRRAHFRAEGIFAKEFGETGLTPRQKALLVSVYQHPGQNQNMLAERIAIDRNSFAEMVNRMVARSLVRRERSESDARSYELHITTAGLALVDEVMARDAEVEARIIEPIPEELRPVFLKCLKTMVGLER